MRKLPSLRMVEHGESERRRASTSAEIIGNPRNDVLPSGTHTSKAPTTERGNRARLRNDGDDRKSDRDQHPRREREHGGPRLPGELSAPAGSTIAGRDTSNHEPIQNVRAVLSEPPRVVRARCPAYEGG